jgi:parvulin-like peptidyl-prolyl isomerase
MTADENTQAWLGPVMSNHGWHLVKIVNRQDGYIPSLQDIYQQVSRDFTTSRTSLSREQNIDQLISTYTLEYLPLPNQPPD